MTHRIAVLVLLFWGSCGPLFGQSAASGQLNGTITDQSGGGVANAKVTLVNDATSIAVTVMTNAAGQYRIFNLLPSLYDLTIEAPGFKTVRIVTLKINVDQTLTQDSVLPLERREQATLSSPSIMPIRIAPHPSLPGKSTTRDGRRSAT